MNTNFTIRLVAAVSLAAVHLACLPAGGQDADKPAASPAADAKPAPASRPAGLKLPHLRIDGKQKQVVVDAKVCLREGALELLLCKANTKDYESILATEAQPSHVHAALLSLGLEQGMPARWTGWDEDSRLLPPRGPDVIVTLRWKDKAGREKTASAGDWLRVADKHKAALPKAWVFVGSRVLADGEYMADKEGQIITVSNFEAAVLDVPFESSDKNDLREYGANTDAIPEAGTAVEVVLTVAPDAEKTPFARQIVDVDAAGIASINGVPLRGDDLTAWAQKFTTRHPRAMVIVRAHGAALVEDVQQTLLAVRNGGVRTLDVERLTLERPVLPRTPQQVQQEMQAWKDKFQHRNDYIKDPVEDARDTLRDIDAGLQRLEKQKALLEEYRRSLKDALDKGPKEPR